MGPYILSPLYGWLIYHGGNMTTGKLSDSEKDYVRSLANRVREIAELPIQEERRKLWYDHCELKSKRPMLAIFPEQSWDEILPGESLKVTDPYWRQWEWYLRSLIYRHESLKDDIAIEPVIYINRRRSHTGWGIEATWNAPDSKSGAASWNPPIQEPDDIKKLRKPELMDLEINERTEFETVSDVLGDILRVKYDGALPHANFIGEAASLRGMEELMMDMYDRPEWVHELMDFIASAWVSMIDQLEASGSFTLNNHGQYTDSGGLSYTHELPAKDFDGKVRLKDLWGYGVAQELVLVSPQHHEEFLLNYQLRILDRCGLVSYGCCEPYTTKFEMLKRRIPNLRRVSVSPWCDVEVAARELEDKYIMSLKPTPAALVGDFSPELVRQDIRNKLEMTRDCVVEVVLKDLSSIDNEPSRIETWSRIVKEEIDRLWG